MRTPKTPIGLAIAFALGAVLSTGSVLADKGGKGHDGGGKGHDRAEHRDDRDHGAKGNKPNKPNKSNKHSENRVERFGDPHRTYVNNYYSSQYRAGKCPPGLAKKNNGCMPPGQAKQWQTGQPLPRDVRYHEVPAPLVTQLGQPAPGYRYVRVDDNILLMATGTRMVVDAIKGLGR